MPYDRVNPVKIALFSEICDLQESVYEHVKDEGLFADIIQWIILSTFENIVFMLWTLH